MKRRRRDPVEEAKQEPAASTVKVEPVVVESEKETKPEPVPAEDNSEDLPDTEPKSESESQPKEQPTSSSPAAAKETTDDAVISSSSEPKETAEDSPAEAKTADEAMEVDTVEPVVEASTVIEVSETPCAKKEAYQCTEKEEEKMEDTSKEVPAAEPEKASATEEDEQMDSAAVAPSQSKSDGDVTEGMNTSSEELIITLAKEGDAAEKEENVTDSASETNNTTTTVSIFRCFRQDRLTRGGQTAGAAIVGTPEAQWKARYLMREEGFVSGTDDVRLTMEILVPSAQVGRIIGKGGQNVRELQRVTGSIIKQPEHTATRPHVTCRKNNGLHTNW
ncbi:hypothetical protein quinque_008876 [Culex quinquefasciatus]